MNRISHRIQEMRDQQISRRLRYALVLGFFALLGSPAGMMPKLKNRGCADGRIPV